MIEFQTLSFVSYLQLFFHLSEYYITWVTWDQNRKEYIQKGKTHLAVASLNGHPSQTYPLLAQNYPLQKVNHYVPNHIS